MKQWLNLLRRRYPEAQAAFEQVRAVTDPAAVAAVLGLSTVVVPQSASVPGPPDLTLAG
jgi:hypothetical protein